MVQAVSATCQLVRIEVGHQCRNGAYLGKFVLQREAKGTKKVEESRDIYGRRLNRSFLEVEVGRTA